MKRLYLLILFMPFLALGQNNDFFTGSLQDDEAYSRIPVKAKQLTRQYVSMPQRYSLVDYCPTPQSQGQYGTCTSWAVAYAARTIMEARLRGITNPKLNAQEAYSPTFVYAKIKHPSDYNCQEGSCISDALELLKNTGVPKMSVFQEECASHMPQSAYDNALQYKIKDYFTLFSLGASSEQKVEATKKALSQGRPVIISMTCYESFKTCSGHWNGLADKITGYHAMCVVGYDDIIDGGAFRIMNSWGTWWGDDGFVWVRYKDFAQHVRYGYEMYLGNKKTQPYENTLSGSLTLRLATGEDIPVRLSRNGDAIVYKSSQSYPSGTRYRILLSNNEPAYVYVLGCDNSYKPELLFPPTPQVSPALVYSSNNIAIPDEQWYIETDNTIGTDYLLVFYSNSKLPIEQIASAISRAGGNIQKRVEESLASLSVPNHDIAFNDNNIGFSTSSSQTVVPIIVEIPHRR